MNTRLGIPCGITPFLWIIVIDSPKAANDE
jgi:hypothetical protein